MGPFDWQKWLLTLMILATALGGTFYLVSRQQPEITLSVPAKNLPTYHLITASDLTTTTLSTADIPSQSLLQTSKLLGRYTNQLLSAKQPVTEAQLVPFAEEKYVLDTTAVSIPATAAMAYDGNLASGAIVKVWTLPGKGPAESFLDEALVLDVQKVEGQSELEGNANSYVIVLAVPTFKQPALITAIANNSIFLTIFR